MRLRQIYILIAMVFAGLAVQALLASPASATSYVSQGTATSTNLLSGSSASSITNFHYNIATLPATSSVRIQFSKDNASWYSSGGTPGGWDTLTLGQADLSLSAFVAAASWTNGNPFYYKLEINSTADLSQTPTIDDIRLDYTPTSGYENAFVFDNYGNVGIGTTSPSGKLDIHGAGTGTGVNTQWSDLTGAAKITIFDNGNMGIGTTLPSQLFQVNNSGSTAFVVTSGGNVGIGITSPGSKLEVNNANNWGAPVTSGTTQTYGTFRTRTGGGVLDIGALANGSTWLQAGEATALGTNYHLLLQPNGGNVGIGTTAPGNKLSISGGVGIGTTAPGSSYISTKAPDGGLIVEGNMGIGTTNPNAKLTISSNTAIPATSDSTTVLQIVGGAAANSRVENFAYGGYAVFAGRRADGTVAIPSAVQANEIITRLDTRGYGATGFSSAARGMIDFVAGENWTDAAQGSYISFSTTANTTVTTAERMRIDNSGNVGIGTTNPTQLLFLTGSATTGTNIDISNSSTGGINWLMASNGSGATYGPAGSLTLRDATSSINALTILKTSGNVGIGTTGPVARLHTYTSDQVNELRIETSGAPWRSRIALSTTVERWGISLNQYDYSDALTFIATGNARVAFLQNGNVGIGTTNPQQKLQVAGRIRMDTWTADGNTAVYYNSATGDIGVNSSDVRLKTNIQNIPDALSIIEGINGVTYNLKTDPAGAQKTVGVIAQDVAAAMPELTFPITGPDGKEYLSVHYDKLAPVLIEGIKQQQTEITGITSQVGDLNLKTSQNVETVQGLQKSVDDNLVVISNNLSTLNSSVATLNSSVQKNVSDISALQTRIASLEQNTADLGQNLSQLTDTVNTMSETESLIVSRLTDHETRIAALEAKMLSGSSGTTSSTTASGTFDLSPGLKKFDTALVATLDADGKNIFTLNGTLNAKVLGAESLQLGKQASGSGKIVSGQTEIIIPSTEAASDSKIYITPTGSTEEKILYVKKEDTIDGESFKVKFDGDPAAKDIPFNWLVVN